MDLADLNETRGYETSQEGDDCSMCEDGKMVKRYAREFISEEFLGCSNYPRCNNTEKL